MKRTFIVLTVLAAGLLPAGVASAAVPMADNPGQAKGHDKETPGKAKGHDKPSPGKAKGRSKAPGQVKKTQPPAEPAAGGGSASDSSVNENKKITFCHVPPGNPANGHLITTSVNAIQPGHVNHPGDIIPPFSFVKHGSTVSFHGQNWDAAGRAALANGCKAATGAPVDPTTPSDGTEDGGQVKHASLESGGGDDNGKGNGNGILPDTGGAPLGLLIAGVGLAAGGTLLVRRRAQD